MTVRPGSPGLFPPYSGTDLTHKPLQRRVVMANRVTTTEIARTVKHTQELAHAVGALDSALFLTVTDATGAWAVEVNSKTNTSRSGIVDHPFLQVIGFRGHLGSTLSEAQLSLQRVNAVLIAWEKSIRELRRAADILYTPDEG